MSTTKEYKCEKCQTPFTAKKADRRRGWARYCSKSCSAFMREKRLDRNNYYGRRPQDMTALQMRTTGTSLVDAGVGNGGFSNEEHDCNKE